jgi:hypothetical protein
LSLTFCLHGAGMPWETKRPHVQRQSREYSKGCKEACFARIDDRSVRRQPYANAGGCEAGAPLARLYVVMRPALASRHGGGAVAQQEAPCASSVRLWAALVPHGLLAFRHATRVSRAAMCGVNSPISTFWGCG